jgi:two-component system chemotaxis sensor kinase CheA
MADPTDKAREEFLSEVHEIVEGLSRDLLGLEGSLKRGAVDAALINEAFRAVHTLKGLAGLFGATAMGALSHQLEDVLDALRLGRMELSVETLDTMFRAVDTYGHIVQAEHESGKPSEDVLSRMLAELQELGATDVRPSPATDYQLDPELLAVLTEYEEHRLRVNVEQKKKLYRIRVRFDLLTIDKALEQLKESIKRYGEIITYLPTGETANTEVIELDLILASDEDLAVLIGALGAENVVIDAIPRRSLSHPPTAGGELSPAEAFVKALSSAGPSPQSIERNQSLRAVTQTVRVDIRKLDRLMNNVGELAIVRGSLARIAERLRGDGQRRTATELLRLHRNFDRRLTEMQDGILEVRMVPLGQLFDRLSRVVRQIGRELGKDMRLVITGAETEIDKLIVEELSDPLMHMIRNAIDHGIESLRERERVGKPTAGTIALNAFQKGNHVMIEVEDDGRGIDEKKLLERAVSLGKVESSEARDLTRDELFALMFLPGVSTRTSADGVSGRGVGMDVVKTNISKLGGVIDVHSDSGIGTKMTITLPITLAIVSALLVDVAGETFAVPLSTVSEAISLDGVVTREVDNREIMTLRGTTLPLCRLERLFRFQSTTPERRRFVVVAALGNRRLGLVVDHLIGQEDIVIKPLGASLGGVRGFSGATELGDQRVGLVLDAAALIEEILMADSTHAPLKALHG